MTYQVYQQYGVVPIVNLSRNDITFKTALVRVDFNVPMQNNDIIETIRISSAKQTIHYLLENGAGVLLISHLGEPSLQKEEDFSFAKIMNSINQIIECEVYLLKGKTLKEVQSELALEKDNHRVFLLDNIRFFEGEKINDINFAHDLINALKPDLYVNDAFSVSHREHASMVAVPQLMKQKYIGFTLMHELHMLESLFLHKNNEIITAIIGGKKVASKIKVLQNLNVNNLIIVGGMANTFLKAKGLNIGNSFYEENMLEIARKIMNQHNVILPIDFVCEDYSIKNADSIMNHSICDIGQGTMHNIENIISKSDIILWNGPAGIYENERFCNGSNHIANAIAKHGKISIVGGGDTVAILNKLNLQSKITHVSNGGGAFIAWLENKYLPGIKACAM